MRGAITPVQKLMARRDETRRQVAASIKGRMAERGWTRQDMSAATGIEYQRLCAIIRQETDIAAYEWSAIVKAAPRMEMLIDEIEARALR